MLGKIWFKMYYITVHDIAAYILEKSGKMLATKLQKLVYYSQVWSLVWDQRFLFKERINAWAYGPASPDLYSEYVGSIEVSKIAKGNAKHLDVLARETIDAVLRFYEGKSIESLGQLVCSELPWKEARVGLSFGERGNKEITQEAMLKYYSML